MHIGDWETHPAADLFPLLEGQEFQDLCESVRAHGPKQPIELYQGQVLDGRNRLRACLAVGVEPRFIEWTPANPGETPWDHVWAINMERRHLDPGRRAALRLEFDEAIRQHQEESQHRAQAGRSAAAKRRPRRKNGTLEAGPSQSGTMLYPTGEEAKAGPSKTKDVLARAAGVSAMTAQKALVVKAKTPELHEAVIAGKVSLSAAYREAKKKDAVQRIAAEPPPLPAGPFRVIVADPPWHYNKRDADGSHRGVTPYPTMPTASICAMPVRSLAGKDAFLWLWTTNAHLRDAFQVLEAWGFEHKTVLTWVKPRLGLGEWLRGRTEHCLLATRGRPVVTLSSQSTVLEAPAREHSRKPDEFYELVEGLCPGSKVELFARASRPGWNTWGAEAQKFDNEVTP